LFLLGLVLDEVNLWFAGLSWGGSWDDNVLLFLWLLDQNVDESLFFVLWLDWDDWSLVLWWGWSLDEDDLVVLLGWGNWDLTLSLDFFLLWWWDMDVDVFLDDGGLASSTE
jgi:hypothetical protein